MIANDRLFQRGDKSKIWQKYCGFLDLSLAEHMEIQEQLLMEQIDIVYDSLLGRKLMPHKPGNVSEFRQIVPLTTYQDYEPYLTNRDESVLAVKPYCWACTSGKSGVRKWVPYTERGAEAIGKCGIAAMILACANKKGEVNISSGLRALHNMPPPPYVSGVLLEAISQIIDVRLMPPFDKGENEDFAERIQTGFRLALQNGVDVLSSLSSVLIKMGERFAEGSAKIKFSPRMMHPGILWRFLLARLRATKESRKLLPKDLFPLKGLLAFGMDTDIYRDQLVYYWGKVPLVTYGAAESGTIATPAWNKKAMTFMPTSSFREFIPEEEVMKSKADPRYQPPTVLLDELEAGKCYEVVLTHFYGMPFLRYRMGDLIRIVALEDPETGVKLPQMVFERRVDDIIDIAGFPRLDEKTIWQAIANTGVKYEDWCARKEFQEGKPVMRLYLELREEGDPNQIANSIHQELVKLNADYQDMENMLGIRPVVLTLLPRGSFQNYYEMKKREGANLAHLKPPHMNASDQVIAELTILLRKDSCR